MKRLSQISAIVVFIGVFLAMPNLDTRSARAAEPPSVPPLKSAPVTIWRLLGFSQGLHKVRDATSNRFGKHPGLERTDALLRIADPANIESDNPAIRVAAEAKADADLSAQKIKAIRYLAEVGCECSSQSDTIEKALMAALDDCDERVRYEAATAFCGTVGHPCERCNRTSCCSAESIKKLHEIATGRDDNGCWVEKSPDVRCMAGVAFDRCRRTFINKPRKVKKPIDPKETTQQPSPGEVPLEGELTPDETGTEPTVAPEPFDAELEELLAAPSTGITSSLGAASGPEGTGLHMLGDFSNAASGVATVRVPWEYVDAYESQGGDPDGPYAPYFPYSNQYDPDNPENDWSYSPYVDVPIPPTFLRTVKISENYSSIPRDRFFFNYNYFKNTVLGTSRKARHINQFVFGAEKTFFNERTSLEVRIPFGATVNSDQRIDGVNFSNIEYGNTVLIGKAILLQSRRCALTAGVGIGFPTADDTRINDTNDRLLLTLENNAIHLAPFLGVAATPTKNIFLESFIQVDMATRRNDVYGPDWQQTQLLEDQSVLFADLSIGYWLYREPMSRKKLKGIAPTVEIHYSTSIEDADSVTDPISGTFISNAADNRFDYMNMTFGTHFVFSHEGTVSPAVVIPMFGKNRRQFDYELQLQVNLPY